MTVHFVVTGALLDRRRDVSAAWERYVSQGVLSQVSSTVAQSWTRSRRQLGSPVDAAPGDPDYVVTAAWKRSSLRPAVEAQVLDLFVPEGDGPFPLIIRIHGGAFKIGDKSMDETDAQTLMDAGFAVASLNYRLSVPGVTLPPFMLAAGTADCLIPNVQSEKFDALIRSVGGTSTLTLLEGAGHGDTCSTSSSQLPPWSSSPRSWAASQDLLIAAPDGFASRSRSRLLSDDEADLLDLPL